MRRRSYHGAQPDRTGGEDRPRGDCDGNWLPWDRMAAHRPSTPAYRAARAEAREVCRGCDLRRTCGFSLAKRGA